jgi:mannitol/fructose-specific phosphotransferase system IIA component (Ntr-type)
MPNSSPSYATHATEPLPAWNRSDPLAGIISTDLVSLSLSPSHFSAAVEDLCTLIARHPGVSDIAMFQRDIAHRLSSGPMELVPGIVLAHAVSAGVRSFALAVGRLEPALIISDSGAQVRLLFLLGSPKGKPVAHLTVLLALTRLLAQPAHQTSLLEISSAPEFVREVLGAP